VRDACSDRGRRSEDDGRRLHLQHAGTRNCPIGGSGSANSRVRVLLGVELKRGGGRQFIVVLLGVGFGRTSKQRLIVLGIHVGFGPRILSFFSFSVFCFFVRCSCS
jgi:hypothetical protein